MYATNTPYQPQGSEGRNANTLGVPPKSPFAKYMNRGMEGQGVPVGSGKITHGGLHVRGRVKKVATAQPNPASVQSTPVRTPVRFAQSNAFASPDSTDEPPSSKLRSNQLDEFHGVYLSARMGTAGKTTISVRRTSHF